MLMRAAKKVVEREDILYDAIYLRKCVPHVKLTWTNDSCTVNLGKRFNTDITGNP